MSQPRRPAGQVYRQLRPHKVAHSIVATAAHWSEARIASVGAAGRQLTLPRIWSSQTLRWVICQRCEGHLFRRRINSPRILAGRLTQALAMPRSSRQPGGRHTIMRLKALRLLPLPPSSSAAHPLHTPGQAGQDNRHPPTRHSTQELRRASADHAGRWSSRSRWSRSR